MTHIKDFGNADVANVNALGQQMSAAELKITDSAIVSTITSSSTYQQVQQQIYPDMPNER